MKIKPLTFLLALTFLFLFSGSSVVFGDDFQDGLDAAQRQDYKTAYKLCLPLAEQGNAAAQSIFNQYLSFQQGCEDSPIQKLISQLSIERFIVSILPRTTRFNKQGLNS